EGRSLIGIRAQIHLPYFPLSILFYIRRINATMINLKNALYLFAALLAIMAFPSCNTQPQNKEAVSQGLVGYWKLTDDILDYSGSNLMTQTKSVTGEIDNLSSASIQERNSWLE